MQERSVQTRKRLLEASMDLFVEKGFERTSVREIVTRAKVAKGTFYVHFETKTDVLRGLADRIMEVFQDKFTQLNQSPPSLDDIDQLIYRMAELMAENGKLTALLHRFDHVQVLGMDDAFMHALIVDPVHMWLERAIAAGVIRPVPTELYARVLADMGHDMLESAFLYGHPASMEETASVLSDIIRKVLQPE